jgi:serine protease Do
MKQLIIKGVFAGLALLTVAGAFAQDKTDKDKAKDKGDVQQIIITRKVNTDGKTVVEINGDKVLVDGKEVKGNDGDVTVRTHKIKDVTALRESRNLNRDGFNFNLEFDRNNGRALFSEDANRAMLGIVTDDDAKGVKVTSVSEGSAAEKAGLKEDDIITKIDDSKIEDPEDLTTTIRKHKPGDKVSITYLRGGKEQKATAELSKWKGIAINTDNFRGFDFGRPPGIPGTPDMPNAPGAPFRVRIAGGAPRLGMSVQDTEEGKGVKVVDIDEESNAAKAGLKEDDIITGINDKEVNSADEIAREVRESRDKTSVKLKVLRAGKTQNIEVKIPRKLKTADL